MTTNQICSIYGNDLCFNNRKTIPQIYRQSSIQSFANSKSSKSSNKRVSAKTSSEDQLQISISKGQSRNGSKTTEVKILYSDAESSPTKKRIKPTARKMISSFNPRFESAADRYPTAVTSPPPSSSSSAKRKMEGFSSSSASRLPDKRPKLALPSSEPAPSSVQDPSDVAEKVESTTPLNKATVKSAMDGFKAAVKNKLPSNEYATVEKRIMKRMGAFNGNFIRDHKLMDLVTEKEKQVRDSDADGSYAHIKTILDELKNYTTKPAATGAEGRQLIKTEPDAVKCEKIKEEESPATQTAKKENVVKKMVKLTAVKKTEDVCGVSAEQSKDGHPDDAAREYSLTAIATTKDESSAAAVEDEKPVGSTGAGPGSADESSSSSKPKKKVSKMHINKLKRALKQCRKEIERLETREIDFSKDEEDDTYVRVSRYKSKIVQIYKKLAECEGREANMGRQMDKKFKFRGTRYPEINHKISRFVNKRKDRGEEYFPDYKDVLTIFEKCNEVHGLGMTVRGMAHEAEESFKAIGRLLQRRRVDDDHMIMLSYLSDGEVDEDPAENVPEMEQKLRESGVERDEKMAKVNESRNTSRIIYF